VPDNSGSTTWNLKRGGGPTSIEVALGSAAATFVELFRRMEATVSVYYHHPPTNHQSTVGSRQLLKQSAITTLSLLLFHS
jgi:hypothetical protein